VGVGGFTLIRATDGDNGTILIREVNNKQGKEVAS